MGFFRDMKYWVRRMEDIDADLQALDSYVDMERKARVFVTFETEMAQTQCLKK